MLASEIISDAKQIMDNAGFAVSPIIIDMKLTGFPGKIKDNTYSFMYNFGPKIEESGGTYRGDVLIDIGICILVSEPSFSNSVNDYISAADRIDNVMLLLANIKGDSVKIESTDSVSDGVKVIVTIPVRVEYTSC